MAIYSAVPPPEEGSPAYNTATQAQAQAPQGSLIDIDAWTVSALQSLAVSPIARGTGTPLTIPIDEPTPVKQSPRAVKISESAAVEVSFTPPRRPPSRRDSQVHRNALLKGKEGSRQRRRWENDRLMHVPNVQPPQPSDWEVHPTHPAHRVPYQLAQFWDRGLRQHVEDKTAKLQAARKKQQLKAGSATGLAMGEVPRDLRETAKRSPTVRTWVKALEEPIRQYLVNQQALYGAEQRNRDALSDGSEMDSEDEEIVFVGRKGATGASREKAASWKPAKRQVSQQTVDSGMLFDSFGDDESASYRRWLTHAICDYYGLESRSVTLPNPSRRVVYVGVKEVRQRSRPSVVELSVVPRPLWQVC
ncbi:hypothetical protein S40285_01470 [Stachybotrys chlorohalonatus IBT 40285]|uniref:R3H-associated N-terminal domain-containing protein n=1 Tax=Stachybotrys chlorohalonatus (strain IBT 40285) TaxID=1283841 RepID=A0A084QMI7_STAC4|nr:hypothetical protein S40285_01470 [Stachybotrys chlorohalonata IBT 40285]